MKTHTLVLTFALAFGSAAFAPAHDAAEAPYLADERRRMTKMMNDMTVKPTGDVDRDFVAMMVAHHQGRHRHGAGVSALRPQRAAQAARPRRSSSPSNKRLPSCVLPSAIVKQEMKMKLTALATILSSTILASAAWGRTGTGGWLRSGRAGEPSRPRLCGRAVLEHGFRDRSGRQQAAWRHPPGRSPAGQSQPAL